MINPWHKPLALMAFSCALYALPVNTVMAQEQTHSERLGTMIQDKVARQLNADFNYAELELITLLGEVRAADVRLNTRLTELDAGLNQVLRADTVVVKGDWLGQAKNNLIVDEVIAKDAQLTVAYYGKGQSNLHALYDAAVAKSQIQR